MSGVKNSDIMFDATIPCLVDPFQDLKQCRRPDRPDDLDGLFDPWGLPMESVEDSVDLDYRVCDNCGTEMTYVNIEYRCDSCGRIGEYEEAAICKDKDRTGKITKAPQKLEQTMNLLNKCNETHHCMFDSDTLFSAGWLYHQLQERAGVIRRVNGRGGLVGACLMEVLYRMGKAQYCKKIAEFMGVPEKKVTAGIKELRTYEDIAGEVKICGEQDSSIVIAGLTSQLGIPAEYNNFIAELVDLTFKLDTKISKRVLKTKHGMVLYWFVDIMEYNHISISDVSKICDISEDTIKDGYKTFKVYVKPIAKIMYKYSIGRSDRYKPRREI
jgi:hypothetical protein